jgi:RimJ/RimL family protein N-acetyltransferase
MAYPEEVTTARIMLRRWTAADADARVAIWSDPDVWAALRPGEPGDPVQAAAESQAKQLAHWEKHGFGLWAVVPRGEQEPVGWVGAWYPDFVPEVRGEIEIGWTLRRPFWGRGLATEAARKAVAATFEHLEPERVISLIAPENDRSAAGAATTEGGIVLNIYALARPANARISSDTSSGSSAIGE